MRASLHAAHSVAAPAAPLEAAEPALQLTREQLQEVVGIVSSHHHGTAAGPSGWTFEMICAACKSSDPALDVTLELIILILSGELPREAFLLDGLLIRLKKPGGGVRPVAISETWYRFAGVCTLRTYGRGIGARWAPPVMSQRGVRQSDPLGVLLFALTLQPMLVRVDAACEEAPLVAYLDDMGIVCKLTPADGAFRRLCVDDDGVRSQGLEQRLPKCGIYGGHKEKVAAEAAKLRFAHQLDGFTAVGMPLGSAEYVSNAMGRHAATVETLVDTLVQVPLSVDSQFLLLRASLQARMVQLMRTVPREALAAHMRRTDAAVWRAAAAVLDLPPGVHMGEYGANMEGPDKACSMLGRQMMLPLRHGGLGLHM